MKNVLKCFDISQKSKHISTPLAPHMKLSASLSPSLDEERECMSRVPYANVVGSLMYAMGVYETKHFTCNWSSEQVYA